MRRGEESCRGTGLQRLESLGLPWEPHDASWEDNYRQVVAFRARHGHCNVSAHSTEDLRLGQWLSTQRQFKKRGILSPDRAARLEALGVVWALRKK